MEYENYESAKKALAKTIDLNTPFIAPSTIEQLTIELIKESVDEKTNISRVITRKIVALGLDVNFFEDTDITRLKKMFGEIYSQPLLKQFRKDKKEQNAN